MNARRSAGRAPWLRLSTPLVWFVSFFAILNWLVRVQAEALERSRRENLLAATPNHRPGQVPAFDLSVGENLAAHWSNIPDARKLPLVLFSGMSQTYAINDVSPGDKNMVEWLDELLKPELEVFGLVAPNLHNEEALLLLASTLGSEATLPTVFVYGVCFDKFRNQDVRPGYMSWLGSNLELRQRWLSICDGKESRYPLACDKTRSTLASLEAMQKEGKEGDTFEHAVRERMGVLMPVVRERQSINAQLQMIAYESRNALLGIKSSSKRPMLKARYELNRQMLGLIADVTAEAGVKLILYVNPLNPRGENPYVPEEYAAFKAWLEEFAKNRGLPYANLENLVPEEEWGLLNGEPDFKHFRGAAHKRTAEALVSQFGNEIRAAAAQHTAVR